jgi:hypothetical protein
VPSFGELVGAAALGTGAVWAGMAALVLLGLMAFRRPRR